MDRAWQIVSDQKQASNLVGAFTYAEANYPWMGGMFVFNLNFNTAPWFELCDPMRFYSVEGRPAETALGSMPKNPVSTNPVMSVSPAVLRWLVDVDDMPTAQSFSFNLSNGGWQPMPYTISLLTANDFSLTLPQPTGEVGILQPAPIQVTIQISQPLGIYTAALQINSTPNTVNAPTTVPIEINVVLQVYKAMLPIIRAN
jgi:hypothetical protein